MICRFLLLLFLCFSILPRGGHHAQADVGVFKSKLPRISMEASEVVGLWSAFLELSKQGEKPLDVSGDGAQSTRSKLRLRIQEVSPHFFARAKVIMSSIETPFSSKRPIYPRAKASPNVSCHLILNTQVNLARDLLDFEVATRLRSLCSTSIHVELFDLLHTLAPLYHQVIWEPQSEALERYVSDTNRYIQTHLPLIEKTLEQIQRFYGAQIPQRIPYIAKAYPTLKEGHLNAKAYGYRLPISVDPQSHDYARSLSIITHELSHELYGSQPLSLMSELEGAFKADPSRDALNAHILINEALATALNNGGLMYARLTGSVKKSSWYYHPEVDRYAQALYPHLSSFLEGEKTMDAEFIRLCIQVYQEALSREPLPLRSILAGGALLTQTREQGSMISPLLSQDRLSTPPLLISPLKHKQTQEFILKKYDENKAIIIYAESRAQLLESLGEGLNSVLSEALRGLKPDEKAQAVLHLHEVRAPILFLISPDQEGLKELTKQLWRQRHFSLGSTIISL